MSAGHSATTSSLTVWTLALSGMLSGPVERTGTGSSRYQDLARVAFGALVEHPEGGDGGLGAARCGDVGARDVPRFPERPARDPRRARRRERDGNPRAYRQPGARLGARGDPFLRAVPGAGATLADEEIWRGRGSSGARTYVDALGHPETNLRLAHRVLFVLVLSDPPEPPSPCPPPIARSTDTRPRNCREALLGGAGARLRYPRSGDAIRARGCITRRTTRRACDHASLDAPRAKASERGPVG